MIETLEERLLTAIRQNPLATQQQLAERLGLSRESVAGHIMRLTRQGRILGKGYLLPEDERWLMLGGANVDLTGQSSGPFLPGDSNPGSLSQSPGGVGRNIAENLARLGRPVSLVSLIGRDPQGNWLAERITEAGIGVDGLLRHPDRPTSSYLAMNDADGHLIGAIADMGITADLTPERLAPLQSRLIAADTLIVEANLPEASLAWLAQLPLRGRLYADAVSASKAPRLQPLLHRLDGLKVNRAEAAALLGEPVDDDEALADRFLAAGVGLLILSLGADGVFLATAEERLHRSPFAGSVRNDTGAGDALFAGIVHSARGGATLTDQAAFGLGCAGLTLEADQANHPNLSESHVQQWITQR